MSLLIPQCDHTNIQALTQQNYIAPTYWAWHGKMNGIPKGVLSKKDTQFQNITAGIKKHLEMTDAILIHHHQHN